MPCIYPIVDHQWSDNGKCQLCGAESIIHDKRGGLVWYPQEVYD